MKRIILLPLILVLALFITYDSGAEVLFLSSSGAGAGGVDLNDITTFAGTGNRGDYIITSCVTTLDNGTQTFNNPTPGTWTEIDTGECASSSPEDNFCIHGIWGSFASQTLGTPVRCSWTRTTQLGAAGNFRLSGVDLVNPVIASSCNTGFGDILTAPSIETEAGSQVVRVFSFGTTLSEVGFEQAAIEEDEYDNTSGSWEGGGQSDFGFVISNGTTMLFPEGGPTGTEELESMGEVQWRACTVGIRMDTGLRIKPIPTMSEWGLIAAAGFMGIASLIYIRRRKALSN